MPQIYYEVEKIVSATYKLHLDLYKCRYLTKKGEQIKWSLR